MMDAIIVYVAVFFIGAIIGGVFTEWVENERDKRSIAKGLVVLNDRAFHIEEVRSRE
jgi:hypothetical protein